MRSPDDVGEAARLLDGGVFSASDVVAVLGKTEGNGGVNDFTRARATLSCQLLIAERSRQDFREIARRVPIIWSGGTEGLMSPHATVFTRERDRGAPTGDKRFAIGNRLHARPRGRGVRQNRSRQGCRRGRPRRARRPGIDDPKDVHFIQIKTGALTTERMNDARARGSAVVTTDTYKRAKCEPDASGRTRGRRHVFEDSDVNYTRHIRGAVHAVIASVIGDPMCYVSAGAEHQGQPGGEVVAVLARARS
jgi:cyanuric acid amidohydrolase